MSTSNIESQDSEKATKSRYYIQGEKRIHEDAQGQKWVMKPATGGYDTGFESIFYNQILDSELKTVVLDKITNATGKMESLKFNDKWYNVFINQDNPDNSTLSTKSEIKYDEVSEEVKEVENKSKPSSQFGQKKTGYADEWGSHVQTLDDFLAGKTFKLQPFWRPEKGVPLTIIQTPNGTFVARAIEHITYK